MSYKNTLLENPNIKSEFYKILKGGEHTFEHWERKYSFPIQKEDVG
jgi:hypothetical protein